MTNPWIEAMRLRTLPLSLAGVVLSVGYIRLLGHINWLIILICVAFATLAQIASNFANEYFDYKAGLDRPGRVGPRRGVTEGDISAAAMKRAILFTLVVAAALGSILVFWGGLKILFAGILIVFGALAYSTGPFPLSRHGLGEVAVILFFGIAPVTLTFYLNCHYVDTYVWAGSIALGLMCANVLLVNNIRDIYDDREVGKNTIVTIFGRRFGSFLYLFNGWIAIWLMGSVWTWIGGLWLFVPSVYIVLHTLLWYRVDILSRLAAKQPEQGFRLNPMLGITAILTAVYSFLFAIAA